MMAPSHVDFEEENELNELYLFCTDMYIHWYILYQHPCEHTEEFIWGSSCKMLGSQADLSV